MKIFCCGCQEKVDCLLVSGDVIYPHRQDLSNKNFYKCTKCSLYVGTHKGTTNPLGVIPTREIMNARKHIHAILDPIWQSKTRKRKWCYKEIAKRLGIKEYHTGNTRTIEECRKVYKTIIEMRSEI